MELGREETGKPATLSQMSRLREVTRGVFAFWPCAQECGEMLVPVGESEGMATGPQPFIKRQWLAPAVYRNRAQALAGTSAGVFGGDEVAYGRELCRFCRVCRCNT